LKILALDTTSAACSVALLCGSEVREHFVRAERDHTRRLLPMVEQILAEAGLTLNQVDALAVSRGPGSFTGLRIAISCVQGLAFAADKPVLPVSSLAALAAGAVRAHPEWLGFPVIAALDARMQEVYWGIYRADAPNQSLLPEAVQKPDEVIQALRMAKISGPFFSAGPGWHYAEFAAVPVAASDQNCAIHARDIAELALPLWQAGAAISAEQLQPKYLRNEVTWQKRQRIRTQK
jgi:tRNA threonylcarbamoyladenosine biosynthesis protein TsaB